MDDVEYRKLASTTLREIEDLFDNVDADLADMETAGDVITITFANGARVVANTQGPAQQIWLAGNGRGWHFSYAPEHQQWRSDKNQDEELLTTLKHLCTQNGLEL